MQSCDPLPLRGRAKRLSRSGAEKTQPPILRESLIDLYGQRLTKLSHESDTSEPAGILRRVAALAYDLLLLGGVLMIFTLAVSLLRGGRSIPPGTLWFQLSLGAVILLFFTGFWVHGGQTLGMRAWRLRIVSEQGDRVSWGRALARFAGALVAAAPAGLGLWWAAFDADRRAWHDRLSGTRVLHERSRRKTSAHLDEA